MRSSSSLFLLDSVRIGNRTRDRSGLWQPSDRNEGIDHGARDGAGRPSGLRRQGPHGAVARNSWI